jgi:hypothetical protein
METEFFKHNWIYVMMDTLFSHLHWVICKQIFQQTDQFLYLFVCSLFNNALLYSVEQLDDSE